MTCLTVSQLLPIPKYFKPNTDCSKSNVLEIFSRWFISLASIGEHDIHPTSPSTFCYRIVSVGFCVLSYYVFVHGVSRITLPRNERWNKVDVNSYNIVQSWCSLPGATDMQLLIMQDCQSLVIGDTTLTTLSILLQTIETHLLISSIITTKTMIYFRFANVEGLMLLVRCTRPDT